MVNNRFVWVSEEWDGEKIIRVIVDRVTGVNYLYALNYNGGGLTVLVDKDGKPIVTPIPVN